MKRTSLELIRINMKANILSIVIFIVIIIVYFLLMTFTPSSECINERELRDKFINGRVYKKYIDYNSHLNPKLRISGSSEIVIFENDVSDFYSFVQIGDSVKKAKGSLNVQVIRNNLDTVFKIDYRCID